MSPLFKLTCLLLLVAALGQDQFDRFVREVDGGWTPWGAWGSCTSSSCSMRAYRTRTRACTNPTPSGGGSYCSGSSSQRQSCTREDCKFCPGEPTSKPGCQLVEQCCKKWSCPVRGGWSDWGSWNLCSKTCGNGTRTRSRTCTNPQPDNGGQYCDGSSSSSGDCNTHICPTRCPGSVADIVFLVDDSGSVSSSDFAMTKNFVKDVVDGFTVGSSATQFGMITFANNAQVEFHLNRYTSKSAVMNAVDRVPYTSGGTNTHLGLQYAADTSFSASNGARSNALKIAVVVTDGRSSNEAATLAEARRLRNMGVSVFAVGVGNIDRDELNGIASDPDSDHVFVVGNASALSGIKQSLQDKICKDPPPCKGWSSWSWRSCSRSCGGGTRYKSRTCLDPPSSRARCCKGSSSGSEGCNTQPCRVTDPPPCNGWSSWSSFPCKGRGVQIQ